MPYFGTDGSFIGVSFGQVENSSSESSRGDSMDFCLFIEAVARSKAFTSSVSDVIGLSS